VKHENSAVTVLGLGPMGTALAAAFLAADHPTTVWNRTPSRADGPVRAGATAATSAAEAVMATPLTVVCLANGDVVRDVLTPLAGELAGRTLVNTTSGSPPHAREMAQWARAHDIDYLDAVLMTTPVGIGDPNSLQLYAGSRTAFDARRATLAALGSPIHVGTDSALASVYDTALLGLMWGTLTGWLHAVALIGADGPGGNVSATAFTEVADRWMGSVRAFMNGYAAQIDDGHYPGGEFPLELHAHTMGILAHASRLRGVEPTLPDLYGDMTRRALAAGHGDDSFARLIEFIRAASPA